MGTIRRGVHRLLEDEANRLIKESLQGVTKHSEKADILTPWKEQARYRREVYVSTGVPDSAMRLGMSGTSPFFSRRTAGESMRWCGPWSFLPKGSRTR